MFCIVKLHYFQFSPISMFYENDFTKIILIGVIFFLHKNYN